MIVAVSLLFSVYKHMLSMHTPYMRLRLSLLWFLAVVYLLLFVHLIKQLYASLGHGQGARLPGFIAILIGVPSHLLLWRYGAALRARCPYDATSD
ncbi:hypothetical protein BDV97DRAFT_364082 [Delphinella strobiligena]|nr:hypothetical protein BDV97DRAFT_364082 [Delphinella strobiligena]